MEGTSGIKESIAKLIEILPDKDKVNDFARNKFYEKYKAKIIDDGIWRDYQGFDIISETQLKINYCWNYEETSLQSSFIVDVE